MADLKRASLCAPGAFSSVVVSRLVASKPDIPRYPGVTVEEEVQALLLHYYGRRISGRALLDTMSDHGTVHVRLRGIAESVKLHPQKRCGCTCTRSETIEKPGVVSTYVRHVCPQLIPKYPNVRVQVAGRHGMLKVTCACGGCERGHTSPDGCRWLDWSAPVLEVRGA
jgi:hypothetical protein